MIDFEHVWLPQIVSYAKLISSGQLEDEWLGRVVAATSVTDPHELYEQMFDDLDADGIWAENRSRNGLSPQGIEALDSFISTMREIDQSDARLLVASKRWETTKQAARSVVLNVR